jgi:hypothetical protein
MTGHFEAGFSASVPMCGILQPASLAAIIVEELKRAAAVLSAASPLNREL